MSSSNGHVIENEVYPTPKSFVRSLLDFVTVRPTDNFLEPCRGATRVIYDAVNLPEEQKFWAEISEGRDYLATDFGEATMDLIITNPPFSMTEEFIRKSLKELKPDGTLIYLQRVNYLGALKRRQFWTEVGYPNKFSVLMPRPKFVGKGGDSTEYAWFVWDHGDRFQKPQGLSFVDNPYIEEEREEERLWKRQQRNLAKGIYQL